VARVFVFIDSKLVQTFPLSWNGYTCSCI